MSANCVDEIRKEDPRIVAILQRASKYQKKQMGYDGQTAEYIYASPFCPVEQRVVGGVLEPIVAVDDWQLGDSACVTVNHYNALVLNSKNLLILDNDYADPRLNKWAVRDVQQVSDHLHDLAALDKAREQPSFLSYVRSGSLPFRWADQTWKVYTTARGARVICTSLPFPLDSRESRHEFIALCRFLGVDPLYAHKCVEQESFRARLTPKDSRDRWPVCFEAMTLWEDREAHPLLMAQVALHDLVTAYEGPANIKDEVSIAE